MLALRIGLMAAFAIASPLLGFASAPTSVPDRMSASDILWSLQKLQQLGRVLYVAAHPDDENTNVISYLSLGGQYDTAYLSLTRGDGGQNLIGPELGDYLGVIRTQELIEARRIDGGQQFFSRAKDFGYSKTAEETLRIWDKDQVLADTVWTLRSFRPDVIVTRFGPERGFTHGHHTASTLLALEAFEAAADPNRFPEQLAYVEPWQAARIVWNASSWFFRNSGRSFDASEYVAIDVGGYDPLLGKSYNEIAAASRSMHRSQGFGTRVDRGSRIEYFSELAGLAMDASLFDGVDTTWRRIEGGEKVGRLVAALEEAFDPSMPEALVPGLLELRTALQQLADPFWSEIKLKELDTLVAACLGLNLQALVDRQWVVQGETVPLSIEVVNRSSVSAQLVEVELPAGEGVWPLARPLPFNERVEATRSLEVSASVQLTQPFWLANESSIGMYAVAGSAQGTAPESAESLSVVFRLEIGGQGFSYRVPLERRLVDPAIGELRSRVGAIPSASVAFLDPVMLFPNFESRVARVSITAARALSGVLSLQAPEGWRIEPANIVVSDLSPEESRVVEFQVEPAKVSGAFELEAKFESDGRVYDRGLVRLTYPHIRDQALLPPAAMQAVAVDLDLQGEKVGYIEGAGDRVAESIAQLGYDVVPLDSLTLRAGDLEDLDAVVLGVRAYNVVEGIDRVMPLLFDYAARGGVVIVQYNTNGALRTERLAPYSLAISRERVTDESAPVTFIAPEHRALNYPNRITAEDFEGWVQERGLYFPNDWDPAFEALLSMSDADESPQEGSLLVARHGDGYFVYTGISWFRQLPAGVPGAFRLFANLLELGQASNE